MEVQRESVKRRYEKPELQNLGLLRNLTKYSGGWGGWGTIG